MKRLLNYLVVFVALLGLTFGTNPVNAQQTNVVKQSNANKYVIALEAFSKMDIFSIFTDQKPTEVALKLNFVNEKNEVLKDGETELKPIVHNGVPEATREVEVPIIEGYELETDKEKVVDYEIIDLKENLIKIIFTDQSRDINVVYKKIINNESLIEDKNNIEQKESILDENKFESANESKKEQPSVAEDDKKDEPKIVEQPKQARLKLPATGGNTETSSPEAKTETVDENDITKGFDVTKVEITSSKGDATKIEGAIGWNERPNVKFDWNVNLTGEKKIVKGQYVLTDFNNKLLLPDDVFLSTGVPGIHDLIGQINGENTVIGTFQVISGDKIKLVFNEKAEGFSSIKGSINVPRFAQANAWTSNKVTTQFGNLPITVYLEQPQLEPTDNVLVKWSDSGSNAIYWHIGIGRNGIRKLGDTNGKEYGVNLKNVILEDTLVGEISKADLNNISIIVPSFYPMSSEDDGNNLLSRDYSGYISIKDQFEKIDGENMTIDEFKGKINKTAQSYGYKTIENGNILFYANVGDFTEDQGWIGKDGKKINDYTSGVDFGTYVRNQNDKSKVIYNDAREKKVNVVYGKDNAIKGGIPYVQFDIPVYYKPSAGEVKIDNKVTMTYLNEDGIPEERTNTGSYTTPSSEITVLYNEATIEKRDESSNLLLDGVEIGLEQFNGNTNAWEKYKINGLDIIKTTNEKGQATFTNLKNGKYRFYEVKPKEGYSIDSFKPDKNEFEIDGKAGAVVKATNEKISGKIILKKIDSVNKELTLKDAQFKLYNKDGIEISTDINGRKFDNINSETGNFITDENGKVEINKLAIGEYKIKEVIAPEGYQLTDKEIEINIKEGENLNNPKVTVVENTKQANLVKFDLKASDTKKLLPGGKFKIFKLIDNKKKTEENIKQEEQNANSKTEKSNEAVVNENSDEAQLVKNDVFDELIVNEDGIVLKSIYNYVNLSKKLETKAAYIKKDDGTFEFMLAPGQYYMIQTEYPSGYVLPKNANTDNRVNFTVDGEANKVVQVHMINDPVKKPIPHEPTDNNKIVVPPNDPSDPKLPKTGKVTKTNTPTKKSTPIKTNATTLFGLPRTGTTYLLFAALLTSATLVIVKFRS